MPIFILYAFKPLDRKALKHIMVEISRHCCVASGPSREQEARRTELSSCFLITFFDKVAREVQGPLGFCLITQIKAC